MATNNLPTTAKAVSADIVVSTMFPTSEEVGQALRSGVRLVIDSDGDGGAGRSLSALEATTIDDVFGMELTKAGEVLGTPLTLRSFEGLRSSDFDDSVLGVWAIFTAITPDGEVLTIGTGATDAVVKLVRLAELGGFAGKTTVAFEESRKATAAGFHPVNLVRVKTADGF